jgi:RHS repeat-associated protein
MVGAVVTMTKYYFAGGAYEIQDDGSTQTTLKYYSIAGMMVAMDDGTDLVYFANDHLSSASLVMDDSGTLQSENRYMPFGEVRDINGVTNITETDFGYTGQRNITDIGLLDYNARFYSPTLMRFTQPDTIIPNPSNPQSYNRYSYVLNNPLIHIDPTGHKVICMDGGQCFNTDPGSYNYIADPRKDYKRKDKVEEDVNNGDGGGGGEDECSKDNISACVGDEENIGKLDWSGTAENPDWISAEEFTEFQISLYYYMWKRQHTGLPLPKATWDRWHVFAFRQQWEYGLHSDTPFHKMEGNGWICIEGGACASNEEINYLGFGMMAAAAGTDYDDMINYVDEYNKFAYGDINAGKRNWTIAGYEMYIEIDDWLGPQLLD